MKKVKRKKNLRGTCFALQTHYPRELLKEKGQLIVGGGLFDIRPTPGYYLSLTSVIYILCNI